MRIILADDDKEIRDSVARALRSRGHIVAPVADGVEALQILQTTIGRGHETDLFQLLITDLQMPKMDGIKLIDQVVNRYRYRVGVVLISGADNARKLLAAANLQAVVLLKPFKMEALERAIEEATKRS